MGLGLGLGLGLGFGFGFGLPGIELCRSRLKSCCTSLRPSPYWKMSCRFFASMSEVMKSRSSSSPG